MRKAKVVPIQMRALQHYRDKIDELLIMSRGILEAARARDWGLALARQRERSCKLEVFFADDDLSQDVAELVASGVRQMLEIDAQVTELVYQGRDDLGKEASLVRKQNLAAKAYLGQTS